MHISVHFGVKPVERALATKGLLCYNENPACSECHISNGTRTHKTGGWEGTHAEEGGEEGSNNDSTQEWGQFKRKCTKGDWKFGVTRHGRLERPARQRKLVRLLDE